MHCLTKGECTNLQIATNTCVTFHAHNTRLILQKVPWTTIHLSPWTLTYIKMLLDSNTIIPPLTERHARSKHNLSNETTSILLQFKSHILGVLAVAFPGMRILLETL